LARAAAYWNASLIAEARGDLPAAHQFVDRARAIYAESENQRAIALLKLVSGWLMLQDPEPQLDAAERIIRSALEELPLVGTQVDIAYGEVELARCLMFAGDADQAIQLAETALGRLSGGANLQGARARLTLGQARILTGEREAAMEMFSSAAEELLSLGAAKQAAAAWRELAEVLNSLGRPDEAIDAYRRATDAAGVSLPSTQPVTSHATGRRP
jgi:tetratricopeptide (TPR) repeat protein